MTTNKLGKIIFISLTSIIFLVHLLRSAVTDQIEERKLANSDSRITQPITRTIYLTTQWSETINLGVSYPLSIDWGTPDDDFAVDVKINGDGGYTVPPRKDWKRLGWKPRYLNDVVSMNFKLSKPGKTRQLVYTLRPPAQK